MMRSNSADAIVYAAAFVAMVGLVSFFLLFWENMGTELRIAITLGGGMVLHLLAMMAWQSDGQGGDAMRLPGNLLMVPAVGLQTIGWFVLISSLVPGMGQNGSAAMLATALMAMQEAAIYLHYRRAPAIFFALASAYLSVFSLLHLLESPWALSLTVLGASMLCLAHGLQNTSLKAVSPAWWFAAAAASFSSLLWLTAGSTAELLCPLALFAGYGFARRYQSLALLHASALCLAAYTLYITRTYVMLSPVWSLSLPLLALALGAGVVFTRRYQRSYFGLSGGN